MKLILTLTLYLVIDIKLSPPATDFIGDEPKEPSILWNSMIYPLLQMTIYGAVWYQGESNVGQ